MIKKYTPNYFNTFSLFIFSVNKNFFLFFVFFCTQIIFSQYSTKHYVAAAPWDYSSNANEFIVSSASGTASVTITKSNGTVITTFSVTSGTPVAFRPTGDPASRPANAINTIYNDRGLIFSSASQIAVSVRNVESDAINGGRPTEIKGNSSLSSYGNEAIGSSFRVGYYRSNYTGLYAYAPAGLPAAAAAPVYSVMAIDNNTVVSLNGSVLVTLNAGQSYLFQSAIGSLVTASKPVVMNSGQWRDTPSGCGDAVLNQIPPVRVLGTNYLVVRGNGTSGTSTNLSEQTIFIATENNTTVTVSTVNPSGVVTATNTYTLATAGSFQNIFHGINGVQYSASVISSDKKIMVYSGTADGCEVDMACVAPVSSCTGSFRVETKKFTRYNYSNIKYFGYVLINSATEKVFMNSTDLETIAGTRRQIGTTGFYLIDFTNSQLLNPTNLIFTSAVRMSISMVQQGDGYSMASYLSSYNDNSTQQNPPTLNGAGCVTALTAEPGLAPYQWYLNDVLIPGATSQTYVPTETGSYSVAGTKACGLSVASTPYQVNCIPIDAVNDGSLASPFATVISGSTLTTSVKANDLLDGIAVTNSNTTVTPKTQGLLTINAAGIITVASGTVNGIYPIEYELCSTGSTPIICDKATAYVRVTVLPGSISSSQTICDGGNPAAFTSTASATGVGTITYRWESAVSPFSTWTAISGATSETFDVPAGLNTTSRYRRIAITTLGESDPTPAVTITVNPLPTAFAVTGGGAYCSGGTGVEVGLANSQSGINYQLQLEGGNIGTAVAGTGSAISFGKKTAAGAYTVVATNSTTGCVATMTGSVVVTINSLPAVPTLPVNVAVCETGSSQTLTATATVPNGSSIVWYDAATGGNVVNPPTLVSTTAATRTLYGETFNGTCSSLNRTAVILTILATPVAEFATTSDITIACGALTTSTLSYSNNSITCPISGSVTSTLNAVPSSCGGSVTESWSFADELGRTISKSRTITVSPAALPTMTAPADITVACGALPSLSTISYSNGLTGGCEISGTSNASTFSTTPNSCRGTVTETWTATDTCGRALASVSRTITVSPAALSTMTAPADITVACGALPAPSTISYSNGLTGGCEISGTSNASTFSTTPNSCGGTVTETWTATDTCGRALASVSRTLTIQDTTAPTWNISANALNITLECGDLAGLAVAQSQAPTATDNCEGTVMYTKTSGSFTVGSCRNSGTYTNTWIAKDSCGNSSATFTQVITIQDITAPTFVEALPTDVTVECSSVPIAPIVTATDNCGIATVAYTETTTAGACSGSYTLIRTWIAKDTCGLTTTHVQTITVQDTMAPVITSCASNQTIVSDADCKALVPDFTKSIVVADNCTASNSFIITQSPTVGSLALSGSTTITLTIEDSCGNKTTCEANLLVTNFIVANDDIGSPVNGNTGGISFTNVLSSDLLNCKTVNTSDVLTSFVNATNLGITLDGTNVVVAAGTPAGNYTLTYQICEILNPTNCATATVTVVVNAPIIDAVTETTTPVNGLPGGTTTALTANDTLNGLPVVVGTAPGNVSVTPVSVPTGLTLNADGTVTVGANTPAGTYPVEYTICEVTNPSNCDTVISNVVVSAAQIIAINDEITVDSTLNPLVLMPFSKDYGSGVDTLNGVEVTFDQITVTVTDIVLPGGQSFPVPKVDSVTKEIVIPASVPAGVYTIFYTICEKLNLTNCSNATIKITVKSPVIISEDDILPVVNGASGSSNAGNVLVANAVDPDRLNGVAATINLVNITVVSPASRLVGGGLVPFLNTATGIVEVPSGTPAGTYTIVYAICDKINPTVCDQSTVTVVVNTINAIQDNTVFFFETVGGISSSVLLNDTVNRVILTPSTFNTVTLTGVSVPSGLTLNADGTITVPSTMIAGVYDVVYEICTKTLPVICSRATMQVIVQAMPAPAPPSVFADDDKVGPIDGIRGVKNVLNVFENDFIELIPATTSNVIIAVITPDPMGSITLNPDGSVDVKAGTPSGTYAVDYEICTKKSPIVCDQATVRITVVAPIITATNDDYSNQPINSSKGAVLDVLVNDRINNGSVNSVQVVVSIVDSNGVAGVSVDAQGKITIPVGTPVGTYVLAYSICDVINPNNCATATVTIVVKDPCDFDDSDSSCDILVHNAFSPNNDGDNQVFTIDRIENYPENTVEIYNRWGVLVFEVEGYDNTSKVFVGISEGRVTVNKADALPNGTYYYVVKYKKPLSGVMKQKAGFLYLSR